jgi:hypothetical protein
MIVTVFDWVLPVIKTETLDGDKSVTKVRSRPSSKFLILFQRWRMHALVWSIWSGRGDEVEEMKDEELTGSPVAGIMAQMWDEQLAGKPAAELMEQIQDEQFAGDLAAEIVGTGAPPRAHQSFSRCKTTQCPNPNLAR